jgi:YidC/Oxa1 family membrane protein insertase
MILANGGSIFDPIYNFFGAILAFFYNIVPNLGISIILMTVVVMLALFPLTAKQAKAMMAMQRAQPEIKKLQAKYKNDRQKLNEEMMKFYQENHINPLAGCLPLLVQMPVFFALFRVLRQPYQHVPSSSSLYAAFCTNAHGKVVGQTACGKSPLPNPQYFLGIDLSQHATGVTTGFLDALPYFILVALVIVTGFMQARQNRRNSPNMTGQMAMVTNILPIAFGLFSLQFPAGLVLYFLVSNLWRLGQQELIMRKITRPAMAGAGPPGTIDVKSAESSASPAGTKGGGLRKLFQLPAAGNGAAPSGNGEAAEHADTGEPEPENTPAPPAAKEPVQQPARQPAKPPVKQPTKASTSNRSTNTPNRSTASRAAQPASSRRTNKKRKRR